MKDDIDYIGTILKDAEALAILDKVVLQKATPKTFYNIKDAKEAEIIAFIEKNKREPSLDSKDVFELTLAMRAKAIREKKAQEEGIDSNQKEKNPWETDEGLAILDAVDLGNTSINDFSQSEIIRRNPSENRKQADEISHAKPCPNFNEYKPLFDNVTRAIAQGHRRLIKFEGTEFRQGTFYSRNGMLFYIAEMFEQKKKGRWGMDGRTHCVFANGTESFILASSIRRSMFENAYVVSDDDRDKDYWLVSEKEAPKYNAGYIYILNTLSEEAEVKQFRDLHKIGFTRGNIENRIKNAKKDTTYLCADVAIVDSWECYDLNPQKLESLVHKFFSDAQVRIRVKDENGRFAIADEWYDVPLAEIRKIVPLILNRTLGQYYYDAELRKVLHK